MNKTIFSALIAFSIVLSASAHPPKKVNLSYQHGKLKIEAIHKVPNVEKHYLDQIKISVDGKEINVIPLKSQTSKESEILEVPMELKKGSEVEVAAYCNLMGVKKAKLKID